MTKDSEDTGCFIRFLKMGEQGLVAELGDGIDPAVNARVHRLASAVKRKSLDGILELVPAYRSLLILFDPLILSRRMLRDTVACLAGGDDFGETSMEGGKVVRIPVCYGGDFGPDLEFVARHNGLSPEEVIALHSGETYPVYLLGFLPGFPYLGGLPMRIAAPRLETPRQKVASGSVGIAGSQTGVYPLESPGGWRIIGRTPLRLFDPARSEPFLVSAGDRVRFDPIGFADFERLQGCREEYAVSSPLRGHGFHGSQGCQPSRRQWPG
jgi:inhibitor of KinA